MAKTNWGITSGFIGKLGNVVGFNWKGKNIQRALVQGVDTRSEAQILQRARFGIIGQMGSVLYDAVYEGFRHEARSNSSTQSGLFLKHNLSAIGGTDPEALTVDYPGLQLSYGKLKGVACGTPAINGTTLSVTVSNAAALNRRTALTDRVYVCAYCPALGDAVCECVGTRAGGDFTLTVPASYADETVYVYAFVIGASSTNEGQASTTAYLGTARNGSSSGRNSGGSGTVNG